MATISLAHSSYRRRQREEASKHRDTEKTKDESDRRQRPSSTPGSSKPQDKERRSKSCVNVNVSPDWFPEPDASKVRTWHVRTGQFQVDAEFLGFNNGLLRLHKTNGVIIEVPSEKMSAEDMQYIDRMRRKAAEESWFAVQGRETRQVVSIQAPPVGLIRYSRTIWQHPNKFDGHWQRIRCT